MYRNVGKKIMGLAQFLGWVCLIAGVIAGIFFISNSYSRDDYFGYIAFAAGIAMFISSWFLYGFGQLVNDVRAIRNAQKDGQMKNIPDDLPEL